MREQLRRAYPQTPPSFDERMRQTLAHLPPRRVRHTLRTAVAIALAAVLALSGLAFAASQSDLLRRLFQGGDPTPEAETLLAQPGTTVERDGVTLTIDEYLMDGADLYIRWTVCSKRGDPLMLMMSDPDIGFDASPINDDNAADWTFANGVLLDGSHPSYSAVSRLHFEDAAPTKPFEAALTAVLLTPVAPILNWEDAHAFSDTPTLLADEDDDCLRLSAISGMCDDGDGYAMDFDLFAGDEWTMDAMLSAMEAKGYTREALRIPVRFEIVPDEAHIVHTEVDGSNVFAFDRFVLTIDRADFTAAGVTIRYRIALKGADDLASRLWFNVLPEGHSADNAFMESKSLGDRLITGEIVARAGSTIPSWVRLVPYDEDTEQPLYKYAVEFRLKQR